MSLSGFFWWRPPCLRRRVIVNFVHDSTEALEGVLWASHGAYLTLRNVAALKAGQPPVPMIGEATIHRAQIAYLQVLP